MELETETSTRLFGGTIMSPVPDPYPVYRRLRHERPIVALEGPLGRTTLIARYGDVCAALKDSETFSSRGNARGIGLVMGRTIIEMEGKEHLRQRRLVTPAFSMRALRQGLDAVVERTVHQLVDQFVNDRQADLVAQFTFTYPLRVMAHIMGLPIEDFEQFHHWALDLLSIADDPQRGFDAAQKLVDYLRPIIAERREQPGSDLVSTLVHSEIEGERLGEDEVLSFLRLLLPAGAETTYRLTGSLLFALLAHADAMAEVRADKAAIDLAIEETLRWESAVQYVSRETTRAVEVAGTTIPEGEMLMLAVGSANRDETHFEDPDRFDMHRKNVADHVAFGFGEHFCLGSNLARLEARAAVRILLERLPNLRFAPDADCRVVGLAFRSPDRLPVVFDS